MKNILTLHCILTCVGFFLYQRNDLELYISVAKCLSEMTDDEASRVAQVTEVMTYLCIFFTTEVGNYS